MASTLTPKAGPRKYGPLPRVGRSGDHESVAVRAAARRLGLRAGTVGQMIRTRGIHIQTAVLIEAALEAGDEGLYARLLEPLTAAQQQRAFRPLSPELIAEVQAADLREDLLENLFRLTPSLDNRRAWLAAVRQNVVLHGDLARALEREGA